MPTETTEDRHICDYPVCSERGAGHPLACNCRSTSEPSKSQTTDQDPTPRMTEAIRVGCNAAFHTCSYPDCECASIPNAIRAAVEFATEELVDSRDHAIAMRAIAEGTMPMIAEADMDAYLAQGTDGNPPARSADRNASSATVNS